MMACPPVFGVQVHPLLSQSTMCKTVMEHADDGTRALPYVRCLINEVVDLSQSHERRISLDVSYKCQGCTRSFNGLKPARKKEGQRTERIYLELKSTSSVGFYGSTRALQEHQTWQTE